MSTTKYNKSKQLKHEQYSRLVDGDERIRESVQVSKPITGPPDNITKTVYDVLERSAQINPCAPLFGENRNGGYFWTTYQDAITEANYIGSGIAKLLEEMNSTNRLIGIAGIQTRKYMHTMHAISSFDLTVVPLYHNSKIETLCDIIDNCKLEVIFFDKKSRAEEFLKIRDCGARLQTVKRVILLEYVEHVPQFDEIEVLTYEILREFGRKHRREPNKPKADSIYVICHTSGTTGAPKGVAMSHGGLLAAVSGIFTSWTISHTWKFDGNDTYFSFLSLAHIYEHLMQTLMLYFGARIGIYNGDVANLVPQIQLLKPTVISLVPRLLNKLYENVHNGVSRKNVISRKLFEYAKKAKCKQLEEGILRYDSIWDKIIFKKIKQLLGGKVRLLTTGGAPLTKEVKLFSRYAYGCPIIEGYGQTECSAAGTLTLPWDTSYGNVGGPAPWAQVKLIDVVEKNYYAQNDEGEVCFRGAALMSGYFQDEKLTNQTIDGDGWLHTGDIGRWLDNGSLQIIDRKNEMFKLSQGDFVSPIQIEAIYSNSPLITQIFVTGSTERSFLVGVAVLDQSQFWDVAKSRGFSKDVNINSPEIRECVLGEINLYAKENGLQTIELIKNVYLTLEEFSEKNGLVTSTLKNRRKILEKYFSDQIANLYNEIVTL